MTWLILGFIKAILKGMMNNIKDDNTSKRKIIKRDMQIIRDLHKSLPIE